MKKCLLIFCIIFQFDNTAPQCIIPEDVLSTFLAAQKCAYHKRIGPRYLFDAQLNKVNELVTPQNFIIDLLINMVIFSGGSYAEMLFSKEDKAVEENLSSQIQAAQQEYKNKKLALDTATQEAIGSLAAGYQQNLKEIQSTTGAAQTQFLQEISYLNRMINLSKPLIQFFTAEKIRLDLAFGMSSMMTPANGYTWYNVYQNADWEFDPQLEGFIQRGATGSQPGYILQALCNQWQGGSSSPNAPSCAGTAGVVKTNANIGQLNYIFTDYYTPEQTYQIQVEATLINCIFPFCTGILFNIARWLSGAPDRMYMHRFVGFYGTQSNGKASIGFYGGQTAPSAGSFDFPVTPLNDIMAGLTSPTTQTELLYTLTDNDIKGLSQDPLVFVITINNSESNVQVSLDKKTSTGTQNLLPLTSLSKLKSDQNPLMFWYHSLGFLSPGAQSLFKIIAPQALTYNQSQLASFITQLTSLQRKKTS